jgi:hypothetical protein
MAPPRLPRRAQSGAEGKAVARRRLEMLQNRQGLVRLRQGDPDRAIARCGLMGRRKLVAFRALCQRRGWLGPSAPLRDDSAIAVAIGRARARQEKHSSAEAFRDLVALWIAQGVSAVAIHAALCREHDYTGSYSSDARSPGPRRPNPALPRGVPASAVVPVRSGPAAARGCSRGCEGQPHTGLNRAPGRLNPRDCGIVAATASSNLPCHENAPAV